MEAMETADPSVRGRQAFARARRHSIFVSVLRKALPLTAAGVTVSFVATVALSYNPLAMLNMAGIGLEDGKLVMRQPKLEGFDKDNKPYLVTADRAFQDLKNTDVIELEQVRAELGAGQAGDVKVEAAIGRYDSDAETLLLEDRVMVTGADGQSIELHRADIDMKAGTLISNQPVRVTSDEAEITADTLRVYDEGKRIVFSQKVRMTIERPAPRGLPTD